jgi:hypothetical protein
MASTTRIGPIGASRRRAGRAIATRRDSLICHNRRYGPSGKTWFLIGVKTHFLSGRQPPPKLPSLQAPPPRQIGRHFLILIDPLL